MDQLPNLVGMTSADIAAVVEPLVDRSFRGRQVARWIIERNAAGFDEMSDLPKDLRLRLGASLAISDPVVTSEVESADGSHKYLFRLRDGASVEGVAMRDGRKMTFCISSQCGCAVGCTFCVTGALGAGRNLEPAEILDPGGDLELTATTADFVADASAAAGRDLGPFLDRWLGPDPPTDYPG